jgi:putative transposase
MKRESRTRTRQREVIPPPPRRLPLVDVWVDARAALWDVVIRSGLKVVEAMFEEDRAALCGRRYQHDRARAAWRAGTVPSAIVLGGRKVAVARPRVRTGAGEVALPTFRQLAASDALTDRVVEQMLVGVATRRYGRSLEGLASGVRTRGISKSSVSRRFVARTREQVAAWQSRSLADLDLAVVFIDGIQFARQCLVVALGIDSDGDKHVLGVWDGSTENATVCKGLLANLSERGLRTDRSVLVVIDGSKAIGSAVAQVWGRAAWIQRCQVHKLRNVVSYLPASRQSWARAIMRRAYRATDVGHARRQLEALAQQLEADYPSAAASLREGLDDTLTVLGLPVGERLRRSLATTNTIECLIGRVRQVHRNVKRWRGRHMALRWAVAGLVEAADGFHRLVGHRDMRALVNALRARDAQLQLTPTKRVA